MPKLTQTDKTKQIMAESEQIWRIYVKIDNIAEVYWAWVDSSNNSLLKLIFKPPESVSVSLWPRCWSRSRDRQVLDPSIILVGVFSTSDTLRYVLRLYPTLIAISEQISFDPRFTLIGYLDCALLSLAVSSRKFKISLAIYCKDLAK